MERSNCRRSMMIRGKKRGGVVFEEGLVLVALGFIPSFSIDDF